MIKVTFQVIHFEMMLLKSIENNNLCESARTAPFLW